MQDDPFSKWQDPAVAALAITAEAKHAQEVRVAASRPVWRRDRRVVALCAGGALLLALIVGTTLSAGSSASSDPAPPVTATSAGAAVETVPATPTPVVVPDTGKVTFDQH